VTRHGCPACRSPYTDLGRACDGRRAYRCRRCGTIWTRGLHGRTRRYSPQRPSYQFADTGAYAWGAWASIGWLDPNNPPVRD
jgi:transposase-like protein